METHRKCSPDPFPYHFRRVFFPFWQPGNCIKYSKLSYNFHGVFGSRKPFCRPSGPICLDISTRIFNFVFQFIFTVVSVLIIVIFNSNWRGLVSSSLQDSLNMDFRGTGLTWHSGDILRHSKVQYTAAVTYSLHSLYRRTIKYTVQAMLAG